MTIRPILALAPIMLLAACGDDDPAGEAPVEQGGEAVGEVLGGTISDDMIALDELTSTSPPAEPSAITEENDGGADEPAEETEPEPEQQEAEATSPAAPAPASTPTVAPPLD